jgi:hypothetical protein
MESESMNKKISTALLILAVLVINTKSSANNISLEQDMSYHQMTGKFIERELTELQDMIAFQEKNDWTSSYRVTAEISDVVSGIAQTFVVGKEFDFVTRSQEGLFRKLSLTIWGRDRIRMMNVGREATIKRLRDVFEPYHHPEWPYEDKVYSMEDREKLVQLAADLKKADLGRKNAMYKGDSEFDFAVKTLYTLQKGEEGAVTAQSVSP